MHEVGRQDELSALLPLGRTPQLLATGATWSEGPCWVPRLGALLWSDIPGNRILRWDESHGLSVHRSDVEFTNGRTLDAAGQIVHCSHGRRAIEREDDDQTCSIIIDRVGASRLNSPNDVVIASDGAIWFTDPPYGIKQAHEGHPGAMEYGGCHVFRYVETTGELTSVITDLEEPNGLAFSPDERVVYVADTSAALRTDGTGNHHIAAYDVASDWSCTSRGIFATCVHGLFDGFRVDANGNLWTSSGAGVDVYAADGALLGRIDLPKTVGNVCFGGPDGGDLFIACTDAIYRLRTATHDARSHP